MARRLLVRWPMKAIHSLIVVGTLGVLASSAAADKRRPTPAPAKPAAVAKKPNLGESFDLKQRRTALPRDTETQATRSLTDAQVGRVIKDRIGDLEYCWLKLPAGRRTASAATLHVTIEAIGTVAEARIDGELPAGVGKCITTAAGRWTFPVAEGRTEIEHGITLTTTK